MLVVVDTDGFDRDAGVKADGADVGSGAVVPREDSPNPGEGLLHYCLPRYT